MQFRQHFLEFLTTKSETFAGGPKRRGKLYFFIRKINFCSKNSLGHVNWSFRDHAETFLARCRKYFVRCPKIVEKKLFLRKNFSSKGYYEHVKEVFTSLSKDYRQRAGKFYLMNHKQLKAKVVSRRMFLNFFPMEKYKANNATMPKFSWRKPGAFCAMCEKVQRSL